MEREEKTHVMVELKTTEYPNLRRLDVRYRIAA